MIKQVKQNCFAQCLTYEKREGEVIGKLQSSIISYYFILLSLLLQLKVQLCLLGTRQENETKSLAYFGHNLLTKKMNYFI